jgi:predicted permease
VLKEMLRGLVKNPFILSVLAAVLLAQLPVRIPSAFMKAVGDLGQIATPLMLVVLGGQFKLERVSVNRQPIFITTLNKLVLLPAIMLGVGMLMGLRGVQLAPVFGVFAAPTAISSLAMAKGMGGDGDLAGQIILITTLFSILTIVGFVFGLRSLGVI